MKRVYSGVLMGLLGIGLIAALAPRGQAEDQKPAPAGMGTIAGKVLDKDGKPIEKAMVRIAKAMATKPAAGAGGAAPTPPPQNHAAEPGEGKPAGPATLP